MKEKTFAIIPARGGSKQIIKKNLINFCGKPLLAWSILQAKASAYIDQVYVTSDCAEILTCAEKYGAIPLKRPANLATDTASSEDALIDALQQIKQMNANSCDYFVFLQATSPLRHPKDIDLCINKKFETGADTVFSAVATGDLCAWQKTSTDEIIPFSYQPDARLPRQQAKKIYVENGSIYICDVNFLIKNRNRMQGKIAVCVFPAWKIHEIDELEGLVVCEALFNYHQLSFALKNKTVPINHQLVVYDFDGVMTNNRALLNQDGIEAVIINRSDGLAISLLKQKGKKQLLLSTEANPVVAARAKKLNIEVIQDCADKENALLKYCEMHNIALANVLYVGNDVNDIAAMKAVGYSACPSDAHPEILSIADYVTKAKGGEGVIRELSELLIS